MVEPAAAKKQITTELSNQQVTLSAQQQTAVFQATVYNDSDRFASFQVKLLAAGILAEVNKPWYRLTPSVSSKIPAGDCTRFQIEVFDLPPINQQFRGVIDLTVEVTSRELDNQYDRQPLRLLVEGLQGQPPTVSLAATVAKPGESVEITAQLTNPTRAPIEATVRLTGLPDRWFPAGSQQTLTLPVGKPQLLQFDCEVPPPPQALSQPYPLRLEVTGRFPTVATTSELQILPAGKVIFGCDPLEKTIPEVLGRWQNPSRGTATFGLQFQNQSNLDATIALGVKQLSRRRRWFWQPPPPEEPEETGLSLAAGVSLGGSLAALPIGSSTVPLYIERQLPWLGWDRLLRYEVTAQASEPALTVDQSTQTLEVRVFPVLPVWLQSLGLLLMVGLAALIWGALNRPGHQGAINSVQFSGQGKEVLTGSDDQTILRWQQREARLIPQNRMRNLKRAVRVARYRPVNNDQVAIGFENGEIQLANLLTGERARLTPDKDDRVFALAFSRDARTLFSGHGSGLVLQWDASNRAPEQTTPERAYDTQFAIQAMTLVGDDRFLAVGGRYNRFVLLDLEEAAQKEETKKSKKTVPLLNLSYPSGSSTDYITSLSQAEQQSNLLAVGDTQGRLSLWDMQACLQNKGRCGPIDKPWLGHAGSPVRAVALSASGCFLASVADDGDVKLWPLDGQGMRRSSALEGRVLDHLTQPVAGQWFKTAAMPLKAVDILETRRELWVASGGNDGRARLHRVRFETEERQENRCPVLEGGAK